MAKFPALRGRSGPNSSALKRRHERPPILDEALMASSHAPHRPSTVSWLNTIAYLGRDATVSSLRGLGETTAPGRRLIFDHAPTARLALESDSALAAVRASVARKGEPFRATFDPSDMEHQASAAGFAFEQHLTEADLDAHVFTGRAEELRRSLPARTIVARRV